MKLYLSGVSKNGIGYTPDTLIIHNGKKRYEYDINGYTDFAMNGLDTRTKGDIRIRNNRKDAYYKMSRRQERKLIKLLKDPCSVISIAVYPQSEKDETKLNGDIISETSGTLIIGKKEASFANFSTEFYGL